jgi:hypothetical protein
MWWVQGFFRVRHKSVIIPVLYRIRLCKNSIVAFKRCER